MSLLEESRRFMKIGLELLDGTKENDIALIKVSTPFKDQANSKTVPLVAKDTAPTGDNFNRKVSTV